MLFGRARRCAKTLLSVAEEQADRIHGLALRRRLGWVIVQQRQVANVDSNSRVHRIRGDAVRLRQFGGPNKPDFASRVQCRHHHRHLFEWCAGIAGPGHGVDVVFPGNRPARPALGLCRRYQLRAGRMPDDLDGRLGRHVRGPTVAGERHRRQSGRAVHAVEYRRAAVHGRHHRRSDGSDYADRSITLPYFEYAIFPPTIV